MEREELLQAIQRGLDSIPDNELRMLFNLLERFNNPDRWKWFLDFEKFLKRRKFKRNDCIKLTSGEQKFSIPKCDGVVTLTDNDTMFFYVDPELKRNAYQKGVATEKTLVDVFKVQGLQALLSFRRKYQWRQLCLTQHQIRLFLAKYRKWLNLWARGSDGNLLFLAKLSASEVCVVRIVANPNDKKLFAGQYPLHTFWNSITRIVIPQKIMG